MTRKDYVIIAKAISEARYISSDYATNPVFQAGIDAVAVEISKGLKAQNSAFDMAKFYSACQLGKLPRVSEVA